MYLPIEKAKNTFNKEVYNRSKDNFPLEFIIIKEKKRLKLSIRVGFGTLSLVLVVFSILFSFNFFGAPALGDKILLKMNILPWSKVDHGFHYTILFSLIISYIALFLSLRYPYQLGSRLSRRISKFYSIFLTSIIMVYIYL